ncbi:polyphosphate polymerase domain-containing protein [Actinomyces sp. 565]|uniref:polyphosphate polymerase domain-containing protein n=1 Tax=Actinomyces sp. 565 TaxID=2057794 RepID=UPI0013A6E3B4|nr:polyphosphate polymerase domain-containing protein [Actinomyces sp. 565]NDR54329.1 polyphosphate polymerase domain-containing protein [Actinomyces sp. 565]
MTQHLRTSHLPAITLDELNAAAGLLTRIDRKYLLPLAAAQDVVNSLSGQARVLRIDGLRNFAYASTYFDTPELDSYLLAARKRRRRFKVRTRSYLDSGLCFLEVKTRGPRGATVKKRMPCDLDDADRITADGRRFVAECLSLAGTCSPARAAAVAEDLVPVLRTSYERSTLNLPAAGARLTVDTGLLWTAVGPQDSDGLGEATASVGDLAIVETKNPATPSPADRLLWAQGHRPAQISKYATGMALLHPQLPSNKWHRVLGRELADQRHAGPGSLASAA